MKQHILLDLYLQKYGRKTDFCRASNENTHKWVIGLVTRKVLKTHEQNKICPKMQDDLFGNWCPETPQKLENDLLNWAFLLIRQAYSGLTKGQYFKISVSQAKFLFANSK